MECSSSISSVCFPQLSERWASEIQALASFHHYYSPECAVEDLEQAGRVGLWQASRGFDPTRGIPFSHYARRSIKNSIMKELGREGRHWTRRIEGESQYEEIMASETDEDDMEARDFLLTGRVSKWVTSLPTTLHRIFDLLYCRDLSQRETADEMGISQPRVAQLHKQLLIRGQGELGAIGA